VGKQNKHLHVRDLSGLSEQQIQFQNLVSYCHEWQSQVTHSYIQDSSDGPKQVTPRPVQVTLLSDLKAHAHLTSVSIEDIQLGDRLSHIILG